MMRHHVIGLWNDDGVVLYMALKNANSPVINSILVDLILFIRRCSVWIISQSDLRIYKYRDLIGCWISRDHHSSILSVPFH